MFQQEQRIQADAEGVQLQKGILPYFKMSKRISNLVSSPLAVWLGCSALVCSY